MSEISLYDLMAEDFSVWLTKSKGRGYKLHLDTMDDANVLREDEIHPYAIEAFATFCRGFLRCYEHANAEKAA